MSFRYNWTLVAGMLLKIGYSHGHMEEQQPQDEIYPQLPLVSPSLRTSADRDRLIAEKSRNLSAATKCITSQLNRQITPYHATPQPLFYENMRKCTDEENRKTMLPRQTSASVEIFGPLQMLLA